MRLMSTQTVAFVVVLLVVSLSAGAAMVFGDVADEKENDKDKDTSSVGGGARDVLEPSEDARGSHDDRDAPAADIGRRGWALPDEGPVTNAPSCPVVTAAWWPAKTSLSDRPLRPRRDSRPDEDNDGPPAPPVPNHRTNTTIPEPATLSLLSLGGLALLPRRRRRC
ncbi:MAG: PEP-CTERM sorting domain-containing protein [Planctomycetota bacterium]